MDCKAARKLVTPYIDGELEPEMKRRVREHLGVCVGCRERFEGEARIERAIVLRFPSEAMPPEVWTRLQARIRGSAHRRRRALLLAAGIAAAACALFAVGLFWAANPPGPDLERAVLDLHRRIEAGADVSEMSPVPPDRSSAFLEAQVGNRLVADRVARSLDIGSHHYKFVGVASVRMMDREFACLEYACCGERICVVVMPSRHMDLFPGMQAALERAEGAMTDSQGATNFEARVIGETVVCFVGKHPLADLAVAYAGK